MPSNASIVFPGNGDELRVAEAGDANPLGWAISLNTVVSQWMRYLLSDFRSRESEAKHPEVA